MNVEELIARCAAYEGVRVATGYPGSPSVVAMEAFAAHAKAAGLHAEWSSNEKVAMNVALGASIAGARAMVFVKSVGLNVGLDPLMCANLCGINAGLVILLGDDPGAWMSQNEQDTRWLAALTELPLLEPTSAGIVPKVLGEAFDISERFSLPVFVRITRSLAETEASGIHPIGPRRRRLRPFRREYMRHVVFTANALDYHRRLHEKLDRISGRFDRSPLNETAGRGRIGVIACGFTAAKAGDVLGAGARGFRILRLATIHPWPRDLIRRFLRSCDQVLVLEENEPVVETQVRALAGSLPVRGKISRDIPREGELFRADVLEALQRLNQDFRPRGRFSPSAEMKATPTKGGFCEGCPHAATFTALVSAMKQWGGKARLAVCGDPGCMVKSMWKPFKLLDVKFAMGGSIGLAAGVAHARPGMRVIALTGDSSFFHSGLEALVNIAQNRAPVMLVILDNSTTALTGRQANPGSGMDIHGRRVKEVRIEDFVRGCAVDSLEVVNPHRRKNAAQAMLRALKGKGVNVVISRAPCVKLPRQGSGD